MADFLKRKVALSAAEALLSHGIAVHWLRPRAKAPIEPLWSEAPVHTPETLRAAHRQGANLGLRLGEPSHTESGYLHLIDLDIRRPEMADAAWGALLALWPIAREFPMVISGSGGESRHIYFCTEKPFRSRKLAVSDGWDMVPHPKRKGVQIKRRHWEVELFGTGKQAVLPPSIHPETGQAYRWLRPLDLDLLDMGLGPTVAAATVESWGAARDDRDLEPGADDDLAAMVKKSPVGLSLDEIERVLYSLPDEWVEDRQTWCDAGMAVHHETRGSQDGFDLWCAWSRQSSKFDRRESRTVWKSFDAHERNPIRMPTLMQAASRHQHALAHEQAGDMGDEKLGADLADILGDTESDPENPLADFLAPSITTETEGPAKGDWRDGLTYTDDGTPKPTLPNLTRILENDPRTAGVLAYNEFRQSKVLVKKPEILRLKRGRNVWQLNTPIWGVPDPVRGTVWTMTHEHMVRAAFEAPLIDGGHGIQISDRNMIAAVEIVAERNRYHPVREMLERCEAAWDGTSRMDYLFIDYLGSPDTDYSREAARLIMVAAVTRIYEPGHKFDFVPILEGQQGIRKSTFVQVLGMGFAGNLSGDFDDDKKMVEKMLGFWIMEMPELAGFSKAEVNTLKEFVTRHTDNVRLSYERTAREFPRQSVFIGTTNDDEYLRDTKNRRYWPIQVRTSEIDTDRLASNLTQLWGEAVATYKAMRAAQPHGLLPLYITSAAAQADAAALQDERRVITEEEMMAGEIEDWLDRPVDPAPGFEDLDPDAPKVFRSQTCVAEIMAECFQIERSRRDHRMSVLIGKAMNTLRGWKKGGYVRSPKWGRQRVYLRVTPDSEQD